MRWGRVLATGGLAVILSACSAYQRQELSDVIENPARYEGQPIRITAQPKGVVYGRREGTDPGFRIIMGPPYTPLECYTSGPHPDTYQQAQKMVTAEMNDGDNEPITVSGIMKNDGLDLHSLEVENQRVEFKR